MKRIGALVALLVLILIFVLSSTGRSAAQGDDLHPAVWDLQTRVAVLEEKATPAGSVHVHVVLVERALQAFNAQPLVTATIEPDLCASLVVNGPLLILDASNAVVGKMLPTYETKPDATPTVFREGSGLGTFSLDCVGTVDETIDDTSGRFFYVQWRDARSLVFGPFSRAEMENVVICKESRRLDYSNAGVACAKPLEP